MRVPCWIFFPSRNSRSSGKVGNRHWRIELVVVELNDNSVGCGCGTFHSSPPTHSLPECERGESAVYFFIIFSWCVLRTLSKLFQSLLRRPACDITRPYHQKNIFFPLELSHWRRNCLFSSFSLFSSCCPPYTHKIFRKYFFVCLLSVWYINAQTTKK